MGLYANESGTVANDVREWCKKAGDDRKYRIVLAGYDTEHVELEQYGWSCIDWFKGGFLKGGMGNTGNQDGATHQQKRERLWTSPWCLTNGAKPANMELFG